MDRVRSSEESWASQDALSTRKKLALALHEIYREILPHIRGLCKSKRITSEVQGSIWFWHYLIETGEDYWPYPDGDFNDKGVWVDYDNTLLGMLIQDLMNEVFIQFIERIEKLNGGMKI